MENDNKAKPDSLRKMDVKGYHQKLLERDEDKKNNLLDDTTKNKIKPGIIKDSSSEKDKMGIKKETKDSTKLKEKIPEK